MDKKRSPADVGERINDTKKEIAQLSEELEQLIKSNAGLSNINFERGNSYSDSGDTKKPNETKDKAISNRVMNQNIQSSNKKTSASGKILILPDAKSKLKSESTCNKKDMAHNKEVTREFMRQQKEKREEQRKKTDSKNKIDQELKKQKLLELQQKSLALVQRNIQLKRERSNSRERKQQLRIDKSNIVCSSGNSSKKSSGHSIPIKKDAQEVTKKIVKLQDKSVMKSKRILENKHKLNQTDKSIDQKPKNNYISSPLCTKTSQHTIVQKKDSSKTEEDLAARKIQACYRDYRTRKQLKARETQLKKNEKINRIKESKETQTLTHEQINFPRWLQPPPMDPYPCNFINTIKKKLQLVVNSPVRCKDVGIQSSIMETKPSYEISRKVLNEIPRNDEKVVSLSQKVQNLDAGALQHLALTQFRNKYSQINKEQSKSDSESDTSKNIPEISTESGLVSEENIIFARDESDKVPLINTDKIKNLTLRKQMDENISDVHKNISKKSYTFNFSEEQITDNASEKIQSEELSPKSYIRSPRDSIISFNISNDSATPSVVSQKSVPETIHSEEIKTEKCNITERESSRRRLVFSSKESLTPNRSFYYNVNDKNDLKTLSDRVTNSLKTSPVPLISRENRNSSHISSANSINRIKTNSSKKNKELTPDIKSRSSSFESISKSERLGKNDHNTSEVIKFSSTIDTSLNCSNPSNVMVLSEGKNRNDKSQPDIMIQSLLNSLTSSKSSQSKASISVDKTITDASDAEKSSSKISEVILEEYDEKSHIDMKTTQNIKSGQNGNFSENSESKKSLISNSPKLKENLTNSQMVKDVKSKIVQTKSDTNEIHLKFEAEVHLLNDFNESLKQFMAVEKAFESLKNKNESSFRNLSKTSSAVTLSGDSKISSNLSKNICSTINMSRGSDFDESFVVDDSLLKTHLKSSNNLEMSSMQKSDFEHDTFCSNENIPNNLAGLSIKMFEQFIKDEDVRIENLKTIIKIREQALLDRTKGELAWLEIQRKHLKETGKLHEASLVKKKQRGILLKHQQERREMQRLKQLQKLQSNERKTILKEQKNLIKAKLTSEKLLSEMKIQTPRKQRPSGPMKVLKARESHSETSLSRRGSDAEEIFSITSRSRSIKLSEVDSSRELVLKQQEIDVTSVGDTEDIDKMKKALLVRQASLMKRRKAVEDLLRRHQKLLEEEKKIKELEVAANAIIMQLPHTPSSSVTTREPRIKSHLKEINSKEISLVDTKSLQEKSLSDPLYKITLRESLPQQKDDSQISLRNVSLRDYSFNTFYENAKATINKMKIKQHLKDEIENSSSYVEKGSSIEYSEDFESEKQIFETESTENNLSSISELIEDFTQIEYGISMFSKQFNETTETGSNGKKINESTQSQDTTQHLNVSSWPRRESTKSGSAIIHTEEMQADIDTLNSIKEISISQEKQVYSTSKSEERDYMPEQNSSTRSGENIHSKLSGYDAEYIERYTAESVESTSSVLLTSNKNEELVEDPSICSDLSSFKIITTREETKENNIKVFEHVKDITEETIEIISNSNISLHSESEVEDKIHLERKSDEDFVEDNDKSTLSKPLEKYQLPEVNIFDKNEPIIAVDNEKDQISSENEEFSEVTNVDKIEESSATSEKKITQNIIDELIPSKSKEETVEQIIIDTVSKMPDTEQKQDIKIVQSLEKEETYQDIPSIENNTELYVSEIKTDDTTNKDISEIDDFSELNLQHEDIGMNNEVEELNDIEKSIEYTDNRNLRNSSDEKESIQEIFQNDADENSVELLKEVGSKNDTLADVVENVSNEEPEIIEEIKDPKSELDITGKSEEGKLPDQHITNSTLRNVEKSATDNSSSNSYTDDFDEDKEDSVSTQEPLNISEKSSLDSTLTIEGGGEVSDSDENEAVMFKIDLTMNSGKNEAKIVRIKENSNEISDHADKKKTDGIHQEDDKLKSTVHQRVSEILANTVGSQKSPRDKNNCQDYYVTTYEDITPINSPESVSPVKSNQLVSINTFNNEAEELLKKQLAIELEIKHLEQQQKEQLPFVYIREIPNKPPPPYTPPSTHYNALTILPARADDLKEICRYSAGVLYKAYLSNNLHAVTFSETHFKTINSTKSTKECCSFVFDLCKEIAENHYKRFQTKMAPSWLKLPEKPCLMLGKHFTYQQLENYIHLKVSELLGFKKTNIKENSMVRWSKKKKDYVDEILILESQEEEQDWLNYDNDELMVKNEVTDVIFEVLLKETIGIYKNIFS